ncbi:MAG: polysaccharide pyruvyl transferase family protein [Acutalibacteraceae bacterium]
MKKVLKKRVATMTFHIAHNYGAMLQAYALTAAVRKLGFDCEVIDYRFQYIYKWGRVDYLKELKHKFGFIGGLLRYCRNLCLGNYNPHIKKNKFNCFRDKVIPHSKKTYYSKDELVNLDYDAILFGSDQIWNEELTNGLATEFFGDFPCLEKTKKIAYAASNGIGYFKDDVKQLYNNLLKDFYAIGVRERDLAKSLNSYGFNAVKVLDPTLLLGQEEWKYMLKKAYKDISVPKEKYLLIYAFDEDDSIYEIAREIAKKYSLKIVVIAYEAKKVTEEFTVFTECGPGDFINLFYNANAVLTTSFHGTVFSIIFHKDFYCIPHKLYHSRTDDLLDSLNLSQRNINSYDKLKTAANINWDAVDAVLEKEKEKSLDFIKNALSQD